MSERIAERLTNWRAWLPLVLVLGGAVGLRVALWGQLPRTGLISDEAEYLAAADWLVQGRGFSWHQGWLWTRAPLYVLFVAAHMQVFGFALTPIFVTQTILGMVNVLLVYALARHTLPAPVRGGGALVAATLMAVYLPFATYAQIVLSETLFLTLLLTLFGLVARWHLHGGVGWLVAAGVVAGLGTLTRGVLLAFVPVLVVWVWAVARRWRRDGQAVRPWLVAGVLGLAAAGTVLPWGVYASRTYGGTVIVDTTGAFNLLLGARTAYDGQRSDAPTRNFVLALLDARLSPDERTAYVADSCLYRGGDARLRAALNRDPTTITQAERQQLMTAEGLCLLRADPAAFGQKSLSELVDLFKINYTGAERMTGGFTQGRLPVWYAGALFTLDDTLYVLLLPLAVIGWGIARQHAASLSGLVGWWWLYNLAVAPLLFAINRFRLPLLPFACIYAAGLLVLLWQPGWWRRVAWGRLSPVLLLAAVLWVVALAPYAYLQDPPASWASYLGPYPSSAVNTHMAVQARPTYLHDQQVIAALGRGDASAARDLLAERAPGYTVGRLAPPLLAGLTGDPQAGLAMLPPPATLETTRDWQAAVVRGDLLRRMGDEEGAKAALTPGYVDDANPVAWAWQWLAPVPTHRIDLAGNLDLGYIAGFYLGEGDPSAAGTFRWTGAQAMLRFPAQGNGQPMTLCMRIDGRGVPADLPPARFTVQVAGSAALPVAHTVSREVQVYCSDLPPVPRGDDVLVDIKSSAFVPGAADLLGQQGDQVGQLRRLGLRIDWAELTDIPTTGARP